MRRLELAALFLLVFLALPALESRKLGAYLDPCQAFGVGCDGQGAAASAASSSRSLSSSSASGMQSSSASFPSASSLPGAAFAFSSRSSLAAFPLASFSSASASASLTPVPLLPVSLPEDAPPPPPAPPPAQIDLPSGGIGAGLIAEPHPPTYTPAEQKEGLHRGAPLADTGPEGLLIFPFLAVCGFLFALTLSLPRSRHA